MEFSYSKDLFELLELLPEFQRGVSRWTSNFLASKGFHTTSPLTSVENTRYDVEGFEPNTEHMLEVIPLRRRRSSAKAEESLEGLRNRRANHAKIAYCCEHKDSSKCTDMLCYI